MEGFEAVCWDLLNSQSISNALQLLLLVFSMVIRFPDSSRRDSTTADEGWLPHTTRGIHDLLIYSEFSSIDQCYSALGHRYQLRVEYHEVTISHTRTRPTLSVKCHRVSRQSRERSKDAENESSKAHFRLS